MYAKSFVGKFGFAEHLIILISQGEDGKIEWSAEEVDAINNQTIKIIAADHLDEVIAFLFTVYPDDKEAILKLYMEIVDGIGKNMVSIHMSLGTDQFIPDDFLKRVEDGALGKLAAAKASFIRHFIP